MNKILKGLFLVLAILLLGWGIYILSPSKNYDNTNSYTIIGSGVLFLILSLLKEKKKGNS
jgi:multisubunit Na+/H+ antiporter MnhC subunit